MVTRLRWAAEKVFTVADLLIGFIGFGVMTHTLKPVSGNTKNKSAVK